HLARKALSNGNLKGFHDTMALAEVADSKNAIVKTYVAVKKKLSSPFKDEDPAQKELITELKAAGFKEFNSDPNQYRTYAQVATSDTQTPIIVRRRLAMMEDTLDTFYYWFALQDDQGRQVRQPNVPKYRLNAIVLGKGNFEEKHVQWGQLPKVGDGFTPR